MRYPKGSIQLSPSRDLPVLRQILRSEFATHAQLLRFAQLEHYERSRNSFDWRIRRLVRRGLVLQQTLPVTTGGAVYSVTSTAANLLQTMGEYCLVGHGRSSAETTNRNAMHAIELNEIHLSGLRAGLLVRWVGSMEVRSQNELTVFGFAKDYDAIVTLRTDIGERRFAIEYERTPKSAKCYRKIAAAIRQEVHVNRLLYLVSNYDILRFIAGFFAEMEYPVFFGLLADWHSHLLEMPVLDAVARLTSPLRAVLNGGIQKPDPIATFTNQTLPFR